MNKYININWTSIYIEPLRTFKNLIESREVLTTKIQNLILNKYLLKFSLIDYSKQIQKYGRPVFIWWSETYNVSTVKYPIYCRIIIIYGTCLLHISQLKSTVVMYLATVTPIFKEEAEIYLFFVHTHYLMIRRDTCH